MAAVGAGVVVLALTALWARLRVPARPRSEPRRFVLALPADTSLEREADIAVQIALSPDGATLVFQAKKRDGSFALYARRMDRLDAQLIPGSGGGHTPFFSPDGRWLAFSAERRIKRVAVAGGRPEIIYPHAGGARGGSWGDDGSIVFTPNPWAGVSRLAPGSAQAEVLTTPSTDRGETSHRWPQVLPGSASVLFGIHALSGRQDEGQIEVVSVATRARHPVLKGSTFARYVPTGHLVYATGDALYAAPFDLAGLRVTGPSALVVDGVQQSRAGTGVAQFGFSEDGDLAYVAGGRGPDASSLVWVDRLGHVRPALAEDRAYGGTGSLSSDGRHAVMAIEGASYEDLWRCDLVSGALTRLTFEKDNFSPVLSPAGDRIVFTSNRAGPHNLFLMPLSGGTPERLTTSMTWQQATGWSPDGRTVVFGNQSISTGWDIWTVALDGDRTPQPLVASPFTEGGAVISPDGRWLAYVSNESGRSEIYVRSYRGADHRWQISTEGGLNPVWAGDGRELFYMNEGRMMAVSVRTSPTFTATRPNAVFSGRYRQSGPFNPAAFAVTPDGQRFLMVLDREHPPDPQLVFVPNWFDELRAKVPPGTR
jgi:serine/threonine-protein kinase